MENTKKVYQIVFTTLSIEDNYENISGNLYESELDAYKYVYEMSKRMENYKETILNNFNYIKGLKDEEAIAKYENRLLDIECPIPILKIEEVDVWTRHYPFKYINIHEIEMICNSQTL